MTCSPILRLLAALITGAILGAAGMTALTGRQINHLQTQNTRYLDQISTLTQETNTAKEKVAALQKRADHKHQVTKVTVQVTLREPDELTRLALEKEIRRYLEKQFLQREINSLDPLVIPEVVDERTFTVEGESYRVKALTTLVSETIIMHVEAIKEAEKNLPAMEPVGNNP
ncbi:MAG: hypothetical protein M0Z31_08890 [Clostridia bacterium]|nr:hypothetical protein [Clostridia bacterium]